MLDLLASATVVLTTPALQELSQNSHHCHNWNSRRKIFQTGFIGTFMIHRHTRPDTPSSNGSLITAIKFRAIFKFHAASLLLFTVYKKRNLKACGIRQKHTYVPADTKKSPWLEDSLQKILLRPKTCLFQETLTMFHKGIWWNEV